MLKDSIMRRRPIPKEYTLHGSLIKTNYKELTYWEEEGSDWQGHWVLVLFCLVIHVAIPLEYPLCEKHNPAQPRV